MQLTRFTDYGLRVLLYVGRQHGRVCTMREIAFHHRISHEHLRKVVHKLARMGYLTSLRGRGGGLLLGRDASEIRIGDLVVALEEDLSIVDCDALDCKLAPGCSLKSALARAAAAFVTSLNQSTLADLIVDARMRQQFQAIDLMVAAREAACVSGR